MKCAGVSVIGFLLLVCSVHAQAPAASKSVFIDAVEGNGDSKTTTSSHPYDGIYSKTKVATRELAITVRNMAAIPGKFTIEWFFIGKPANGTGRFLYDQGTREVTLGPSAFEKFPVESKELSSQTSRDYYAYSNYIYKSGDRPDGWIVRAKVDDEVVRVKASNAQLEQLEGNKEEFAKFISKKKKDKKSR